MKKNQNGVTLIALAVTIIVMLILAGATMSMLTGNSGIIVLGVNNFLHNCRKDLKQRNCFFYRTFFYSISTIFISLRPF